MTAMDPQRARDKTLRKRNRTLLALLGALAMLLYAGILARMAG